MTDADQPLARRRVLRCLEAAGPQGITGHDLCEQAGTNAAVRRKFELERFYGYVIRKESVCRNVYRYTLTRREAWARSPDLSVREARTQETARLAALREASRPVQRQRTIFEVMEAR